jgi:hypothetical protein
VKAERQITCHHMLASSLKFLDPLPQVLLAMQSPYYIHKGQDNSRKIMHIKQWPLRLKRVSLCLDEKFSVHAWQNRAKKSKQ